MGGSKWIIFGILLVIGLVTIFLSNFNLYSSPNSQRSSPSTLSSPKGSHIPIVPQDYETMISNTERGFCNPRRSDSDSNTISFLQGLENKLLTTLTSSHEPPVNQERESDNFDFECDKVDETNSSINFYASAIGVSYENFIPLYAFFALSSSSSSSSSVSNSTTTTPDLSTTIATVEMVVPNVRQFLSLHMSSLEFLQQVFGNVICVRSIQLPHLTKYDWETPTIHLNAIRLRFFMREKYRKCRYLVDPILNQQREIRDCFFFVNFPSFSDFWTCLISPKPNTLT